MAFAAEPVWWIEERWFFKEQFSEFRSATLSWITSLGLDPNRLTPLAAVVPFDGAYELHVDEVVRDPRTGHDRMDPTRVDTLLTIRRILPVEPGSWPEMPSIEELAA